MEVKGDGNWLFLRVKIVFDWRPKHQEGEGMWDGQRLRGRSANEAATVREEKKERERFKGDAHQLAVMAVRGERNDHHAPSPYISSLPAVAMATQAHLDHLNAADARVQVDVMICLVMFVMFVMFQTCYAKFYCMLLHVICVLSRVSVNVLFKEIETNYRPSISTMPHDISHLSGGSLLLAWQLKNKHVLIVGGGDVASGRIESVLVADARITLVAPKTGLHKLTQQFIDATDRITYHDRTFAGPQDLDGVDMVLTAIDDVEKSREICDLCRERKIPINVADIPPSCDFYFGSQVRSGPLQIMISTNGQSPKLANIIRRKIEACIPDHAGEAIEKVGQLRSKLRERAPGVGGELGKKRMRWMIDVCNAWEMEELALLDDEMMLKLLDDGWENGRVPRLEEVRPLAAAKRGSLAVPPPLLPFTPLVPMMLGFFAGVAATAVAVHRLTQKA